MSTTSKKQAKTKVADLAKFSFNNAKESYKTALATYVQFLVTSGEYHNSRDSLKQFLAAVGDEILDLIDFD